MERIVAKERNLDGKRPKDQRLSYKQIKTKYSRWEISESTLRGIKRNYDLPKEHRERRPTWDDKHVSEISDSLLRSLLHELGLRLSISSIQFHSILSFSPIDDIYLTI